MPRQMTLHRFDRRRAQLGRGRPRCRKRLRTDHAVGEMADEQDIQIGEIVFLDDEVVLRGQERRTVGCPPAAAARPTAPARPRSFCPRTGTNPSRSHCSIGFVTSGTPSVQSTLRRCAHLVGPAQARLPALVDKLLRGGSQRIRHRTTRCRLRPSPSRSTPCLPSSDGRNWVRPVAPAHDDAQILARHRAVADQLQRLDEFDTILVLAAADISLGRQHAHPSWGSVWRP